MRVALLLGCLALGTVATACTAAEPVAQRLPSSRTVSTPPPTAAPPDRPTATPTATPAAIPTATPTAAPTDAVRAAPATPPPVVRSGDGVLHPVRAGAGTASGSGTPTPYVVQVEGGLGVDAAAFAREVERILADPRSWGAGGRRAMHRVGTSGTAAFAVVLASPDTTDRLCATLRTNGRFSCGTGDRAVLNSARWLTGADSYAGRLPEYRQYLVNHEVGHVLGQGHAPCPGPGETAPVMLQQTKGLDGCARNPWPYP